MKKDRGFTYIEIIISVVLVLGISYLSIFYYEKLREKQDVQRAKTLILNIFSEYTSEAFDTENDFDIKIEHAQKRVKVLDMGRVKKEELLPEKLKYSSVFDNEMVEKLDIKITKHGNITPSFSFYIFGYDDIVKYRISFYGFDKIRFLKINVYRNLSDKKWKYKNLMLYHKKFNPNSIHWRTE